MASVISLVPLLGLLFHPGLRQSCVAFVVLMIANIYRLRDLSRSYLHLAGSLVIVTLQQIIEAKFTLLCEQKTLKSGTMKLFGRQARFESNRGNYAPGCP